MRARAMTMVVLGALVTALALSGAGAAAVGQPVWSGHVTFGPIPDNECGIDGTSIVTISGITKVDATGATLQHGNVVYTFTSSAAGKSLDFHTSETEKTTALTDNGDGTYSFLLHGSGLVGKVSVPNGPPLDVRAGERDILFTFDANGDPISQQWLHIGGEAGLVSCDLIVPALS